MSSRPAGFSLGADGGGTFTDFVAIDDTTAAIRLEKTPATPPDRPEWIFVTLIENA